MNTLLLIVMTLPILIIVLFGAIALLISVFTAIAIIYETILKRNEREKRKNI